jgi:hypothetical protein
MINSNTSDTARSGLTRFTGWIDQLAMTFEDERACRHTAKLVSSLPHSVQKDIGWRYDERDSVAVDETKRIQLTSFLAQN